MVEQDELAWDPTLDEIETDPLLRMGNSTFYRQSVCSGQGGQYLSKEQVEHLIYNLDEASGYLKAVVHEDDTDSTDAQKLKDTKKRSVFRIISNNMFVITLIIQALNIALLTVLDLLPRSSGDTTIVTGSSIVMIVLQTINLVIVIAATLRLTRQWLVSKINNTFLAQNYFATVLLFAGIYTASYRLLESSWKFVSEDLKKDPILVIELYLKMFYLSVSTATLCGSCTISPKEWFNYLFVAVEMLLSFIYFASILSQSIGVTFTPSLPHLPKRNNKRFSIMAGLSRSRGYSTASHKSYGTLASTPRATPTPRLFSQDNIRGDTCTPNSVSPKYRTETLDSSMQSEGNVPNHLLINDTHSHTGDTPETE